MKKQQQQHKTHTHTNVTLRSDVNDEGGVAKKKKRNHGMVTTNTASLIYPTLEFNPKSRT